jgi:hypothetical protein
MAKKHDIDMIAAWARDWGIDGFEHYDPKIREQKRMASLKKQHERQRKGEERQWTNSQKR